MLALCEGRRQCCAAVRSRTGADGTLCICAGEREPVAGEVEHTARNGTGQVSTNSKVGKKRQLVNVAYMDDQLIHAMHKRLCAHASSAINLPPEGVT